MNNSATFNVSQVNSTKIRTNVNANQPNVHQTKTGIDDAGRTAKRTEPNPTMNFQEAQR